MNLVMPTRILLLGRGGREHALAWKLGSEPGVNRIVVAPGSDGIAEEPRVVVRPDVDMLDPTAVVALARAEAAELAVVGPEAPLAAGVADALADAGVPVFGPSAAAARIETSKAFCHEVAASAGVPMAEARAFRDDAAGRPEAKRFARVLAERSGGVVVKADGLAAGKGVTVCGGADEADEAIDALVGPLVVEERLVGAEATVIALVDGWRAVALPASRDHKRLLDDDEGPNTGGMGAYSPLPDLADDEAAALVEQFHRPILAELARRGVPFRGALYAGLMLTARGPVLLECNARFGDPETQAIVPRLAGPLGPWLLAAARGRLPDEGVLPTLPLAAVAIVLASSGYPDAPSRGDRIRGLGDARSSGSLVFHAGTARLPDGSYATDGGRVLAVVDVGRDLGEARVAAERGASRIGWPGLQRRHDIAAAGAVGAGAR